MSSATEPVTVEDLRKDAEDQIGAARTSVLVYAYSLGYHSEDGVLVKDTTKSNHIRSDVEHAKNVYCVEGNPAALLTVSNNLLKGISARIPASIPALFGVCVPGEHFVDSAYGQFRISVSKARTASVSSIRAVLHDLGLVPGDRVWLIFNKDTNTIAFKQAVAAQKQRGASQIYNDMGLSRPKSKPRATLTEHIFLDKDATDEEIVKRVSRKLPSLKKPAEILKGI